MMGLRITSYNVCYTKLLRSGHQIGVRGDQGAQVIPQGVAAEVLYHQVGGVTVGGEKTCTGAIGHGHHEGHVSYNFV